MDAWPLRAERIAMTGSAGAEFFKTKPDAPASSARSVADFPVHGQEDDFHTRRSLKSFRSHP